MLLLLARHGNTFEAGETAVWVGARTDLPLTAKGREQAATLAEALQPVKAQLRRIESGPLKRTRDYAEIATRELGLDLNIHVDERLREIDYGLWEGKSSEEIEALGGAVELKAWNMQADWPLSPGWTPAAQTITANVRSVAEELTSKLEDGHAALLVTSNGILKFFLKMVPGAFDEMAADGKLKVATGNCCALRHSERGWETVFWNVPPSRLAFG
jgi:broad specificity phosphatase PhoE